MSKKRGLCHDEKRQRLLDLFFETVSHGKFPIIVVVFLKHFVINDLVDS